MVRPAKRNLWSGGALAVLAAGAGAGCAASRPAGPPELPAPSQQVRGDMVRAERLLLVGDPEWPALRDRLAADPVASPWLARMLLHHAMREYRATPAAQGTELEALAGLAGRPETERFLRELPHLGEAAVERVFQDLLAYRHHENRQVGILALEAIGEPSLRRLLPAARNAPDPWVRRFAIQALGGFAEHPEVSGLLVELAADRDWVVRAEAAGALARARDPATLERLKQTARADADPFVRRKAVEALGERGEVSAVPLLADYLEEATRRQNLEDRQVAREALRRIVRRDLGSDPDAWRAWAAGAGPRDAMETGRGR